MKLVNKIAVVLVCGLLGYYCVFGLDKPMALGETVKNEECFDLNPTKCIVISIFSDSSILKKGEPFPVTIKIENISDKSFSLKTFPNIVLLKKGVARQHRGVEGSYRSIVYLGSDSEFVKKKVLEKGEKIELKIDITDIGWGDASLSYFPGNNLFELVPQGKYELYTEMTSSKHENNINNRLFVQIQSNTIKVSVK